jgi:hypothetical protein
MKTVKLFTDIYPYNGDNDPPQVYAYPPAQMPDAVRGGRRYAVTLRVADDGDAGTPVVPTAEIVEIPPFRPAA